MKYNFDNLAKRKNTSCLKRDNDPVENELPMWVADMDFEVAPKIKEAILTRANIGAYGYSLIPNEFFKAINSWWKRKHHYDFKEEWMIYSSGIVAAISSMVRRLTTPGDNVLIQAPVYNIFYNSIINNKCNVVSNDLIYQDGKYAIDFVDLEKKMSDKKTTLMILCNPHNPIGYIWSKEELDKIGQLAYKYGVKVISDEIHCDIATPGKEYNTFCSANEINKEISITCVAGSKTFNIAGLQSACIIVPNKDLFKIVNRGLNTDEVAEPNFFSMAANIAAFNDCDDWVEEMNEYIYQNKLFLYDFIDRNIPEISAIRGDATYLVWVDISKVTNDGDYFTKFLREKTGLYVSYGSEYGPINGKAFIRINLATSLANVKDGCKRLFNGVQLFKKENI